MRFFPCTSLHYFTTTIMSSHHRFPSRGRNPWRRRFSDWPSGGGRGEESVAGGDSQFGAIRGGNLGFRQPPMRGGFCGPQRGFPMHNLRPWTPYRPLPDDFRSWENALAQPPLNCKHFVVLSYNILADYLAKEHRYKLYFHIPPYILDWEWRKRRILIELGLWSPDIMCLQEVDRFQDLEAELKLQGYHGIWKMRTGPPIDGCAIFWRTSRFNLLHEEHIEFDKLGLRNNVAQICVLESRRPCPTGTDSAASPTSSHHPEKVNQVVVCNIHVLYNPNRGDIKIGQVRVLLDRAHAVSRTWSDAPVIVCGDFNCTPKSPLYNFIAEQKINLSGLAKNQVSGQYSASYFASQPKAQNAERGFSSGQSGVKNLVQLSTSVFDASGTNREQLCLASEHGSSQYGLNNDKLDETLKSNNEQVGLSGNSSDLNLSDPVVATLQNTFDCGDLQNQRLHFRKNKSSFEENILSKMHVTEEKIGTEISCQSARKMVESSPATTENPKQNLGSLGREFGSSRPQVMQTYGEQSISSYKHERSYSKDPFESSKESESLSQIQGAQSHDLDFGISNDLNISREISELGDAKDISENKNSIESSSGQAPSISPEDLSQPQVSSLSLEDQVIEKLTEVSLKKPDTATFGKQLLDQLNPEILNDSSSTDEEVTEVEKKPYDPYLWTPTEIATASGNAESTVIEHQLKLKSTYTEVEDYAGTKDVSKEPQVTSYNRRFMGTVDYIWCSEGLQTIAVLDTIPKHVLQRTAGFPTRKWGSDHLAIASRLAFTKGLQTEETPSQ